MGERWAKWIWIYGLTTLLLFSFGLGHAADCWEHCFSESERGLEHAEYEQVLGLLHSFRKALATDANTGVGASNGTAILLDSTLPDGTDRSELEQTASIQKRIGQILSFSMPMLTNFNPGFLVKFDRSSAWSCDDWKCLGRCDMFEVLEKEASELIASENHASFNLNGEDRLDESCEMASLAALESTCSTPTQNIFAVAIVNGNFKIVESDFTTFEDAIISSGLDLIHENHQEYNFDEDTEEFNFYCDRHFPKKAIVGTFNAAADRLAQFPSASLNDWPGYTQITYSSAMKRATDRISNCMNSSCCYNRPKPGPNDPNGSCLKFTKGQTSAYYR